MAQSAKQHVQSQVQTFQPPNDVAPSPGWAHALRTGPDTRVKITEEYARHVARDVFFWAWPLVNVYNKRSAAEKSKELAYSGPVPSAPLNRIVMLTDYVAADERIVACPNQDVVYGGGSLGLDQSPVVIQVPDFGDRFWVYQVGRSAHRWLRSPRQDVRNHAGLLSARRPGLARSDGRKASPRYFGLRPTPASSRRAFPWTIRPRTTGNPAVLRQICCIRWRNMTAR